MGGPSLPEPTVQQTPKKTDPAVQEAIDKERELAMKRRGRQSTILTPLTQETGQKKTLLGS